MEAGISCVSLTAVTGTSPSAPHAVLEPLTEKCLERKSIIGMAYTSNQSLASSPSPLLSISCFRTNAISQTSLFLPVKVLQSPDVTHRDPRCAGSLSDLQVFFEYSERSVRDKRIRKSAFSCQRSVVRCQRIAFRPFS